MMWVSRLSKALTEECLLHKVLLRWDHLFFVTSYLA